MDDQMTSAPSSATKIWGALRPILPWALGLALLILLAGLYAPQHVISWLSWQLYLDRLSLSFRPPLAFEGRALLSIGASCIILLLSMLVGLMMPKRSRNRAVIKRHSGPSWRFFRGDSSVLDATFAPRHHFAEFLDDPLPYRNAADAHPDDAPRPPLRAGSELPAGGLAPPKYPEPSLQGVENVDMSQRDAAADAPQGEAPSFAVNDDAPDIIPGQEPWLQSVEARGPARPSAKDLSLSAMVARLEAGLSSRRRVAEPLAVPPTIPVPEPAATPSVEDHKVDVALEAALGTLKRLNMRAAG
jgi:hypothetical protein